jgi:DNA adenine methylase
VKWAGGKRQILNQLICRLPSQWEHYYEPFVGGGALLIALWSSGRVEEATISDANFELVNLYQVIRDQPDNLLQAMNNPFFENTRERYLELRHLYNQMRGNPASIVERAVLLLYLNRHGYNGLWRVNRKGEFNVPFGKYRSPSLPSEDLILAFSRMLKKVDIRECDFAETAKKAKKGDFVYCDPPYHPLSRTSRFTAYHSKGFSYLDQVRLSEVGRALKKRGVSVMISNSRTPEICHLYRDFHQEVIQASRSINSRGDRRSGIPEVIFTSYKPDNK